MQPFSHRAEQRTSRQLDQHHAGGRHRRAQPGFANAAVGARVPGWNAAVLGGMAGQQHGQQVSHSGRHALVAALESRGVHAEFAAEVASRLIEVAAPKARVRNLLYALGGGNPQLLAGVSAGELRAGELVAMDSDSLGQYRRPARKTGLARQRSAGEREAAAAARREEVDARAEEEAIDMELDLALLEMSELQMGSDGGESAAGANGMSMEWQEAPSDDVVGHLRWYQQEALSAVIGAGGLKSGVVVMPCGSGKTRLGAAMVRHCCAEWGGGGLAAVVCCKTTQGVLQWHAELTGEDGVVAMHAGCEVTPAQLRGARVLLATYSMLSAHGRGSGRQNQRSQLLGELLAADGGSGLLVLDECQVVPAPEFQRVVELVAAAARVGLTATPLREDGLEDQIYQ